MNIDKLRALDEITLKRIEDKRLVFASYAVSHRGKTVFKNKHGLCDIENNRPLEYDTIVRLASMTKPITGVAAMRQVENGAFSLDEPVSKYIPSFKSMNVGILGQDGKVSAIYPARREIIIRDLFNQASGLGEGEIGNRAWKDYHIKDGDTLESMVPKFGYQLLDFEPQSQAIYSWTQAFDVLAYLTALTSGMEFEDYLKKYVLHPLEMYDTVYTLSDEQRSRLAELYDARDGKITRIEMNGHIFGDTPSSYKAAGAAMAGTLDDYMKFAAMLAGYGRSGKVRILKEETVKLMSSVSLPSHLVPDTADQSWGLSMRVILKKVPGAQELNPGAFGWSGAYGTHFFIDPSEELYGVYIKNLLDGGGAGADTAREFEKVIMEAL